jgi:hypothetical protein
MLGAGKSAHVGADFGDERRRRGPLSPETIAFRMRRPLMPRMSETTYVSLMLASSSTA